MADRDLDHLYPDFRRKVEVILLELHVYSLKHMPNHVWKLTDGFRTVSAQQALYAQGRTAPGNKVTQRDGVRKKSTHQYGLAADLCPFKDGKPDYNVSADHWHYLAHLARKHNLDSGDDWKSFKDKPHIEWKPSDTLTYRKAWRLVQSLGLNA